MKKAVRTARFFGKLEKLEGILSPPPLHQGEG